MADRMKRDVFLADVLEGLQKAYKKHGKEPWGRHEFYAILKEEVDELWDEIKLDSEQVFVEKEMVQIVAVCLRYIETGDRYRTENNNE